MHHEPDALPQTIALLRPTGLWSAGTAGGGARAGAGAAAGTRCMRRCHGWSRRCERVLYAQMRPTTRSCSPALGVVYPMGIPAPGAGGGMGGDGHPNGHRHSMSEPRVPRVSTGMGGQVCEHVGTQTHVYMQGHTCICAVCAQVHVSLSVCNRCSSACGTCSHIRTQMHLYVHTQL